MLLFIFSLHSFRRVAVCLIIVSCEFQQQWSVNGGKCGVCGDAYDLPSPRPHEAGGLYSTGVISRTYTQADVINVTVDITANHMGYFTFKLCPNNNFEKEATQTCLDSLVLQVRRNTEKLPSFFVSFSLLFFLPVNDHIFYLILFFIFYIHIFIYSSTYKILWPLPSTPMSG